MLGAQLTQLLITTHINLEQLIGTVCKLRPPTTAAKSSAAATAAALSLPAVAGSNSTLAASSSSSSTTSSPTSSTTSSTTRTTNASSPAAAKERLPTWRRRRHLLTNQRHSIHPQRHRRHLLTRHRTRRDRAVTPLAITATSAAIKQWKDDLTTCHLDCVTPVTSDTLNNPPYKIPNGGGTAPIYSKTISMTARHMGGVTHYDAHNLFGMSQALATHAAVAAATGRRPFVLARSTFPGSGRHTAHWTGDNAADFDNLRWSVQGLLNSNLFGVPLVGEWLWLWLCVLWVVCVCRGGGQARVC